MATLPKTEKTVYIQRCRDEAGKRDTEHQGGRFHGEFGAGFSGPGGPNQALLLKHIFALPEANNMVRDCKARLKLFLEEALNIAPSALNDVSLLQHSAG